MPWPAFGRPCGLLSSSAWSCTVKSSATASVSRPNFHVGCCRRRAIASSRPADSPCPRVPSLSARPPSLLSQYVVLPEAASPQRSPAAHDGVTDGEESEPDTGDEHKDAASTTTGGGVRCMKDSSLSTALSPGACATQAAHPLKPAGRSPAASPSSSCPGGGGGGVRGLPILARVSARAKDGPFRTRSTTLHTGV